MTSPIGRVPRRAHAGLPIPGLALAVMLLAAASSRPCAAADPASPASTGRDTAVTTIILVRHAERDTLLIGADPPLRAEGVLRAQALAHALGGADISAIYVTPWLRNRQTAMPLATALGESLIVVDPVDETVRRLRTRHRGETVLAVGHSNTIPQIVEALTGRPFPTPERVAYDGMWVVTLGRDGRATLLSLRYGAPAETVFERHPAPARSPR
jgi:broad specificity phosphatase PhoE